MIIAFEGIDGSGKTTQVNLLADWMARHSSLRQPPLILRDPGSTQLGEDLRSELKRSHSSQPLDPVTQAMLFCGARRHMVKHRIMPLHPKTIVLCDRYVYSTIAYQYYGYRKYVKGDLWVVERLAGYSVFDQFYPFVNILLDLPIEQARERGHAHTGTISYHDEVRQGYHTIAERIPDEWITVDASMSENAVHRAVLDRLESLVMNGSEPDDERSVFVRGRRRDGRWDALGMTRTEFYAWERHGKPDDLEEWLANYRRVADQQPEGEDPT